MPEDKAGHMSILYRCLQSEDAATAKADKEHGFRSGTSARLRHGMPQAEQPCRHATGVFGMSAGVPGAVIVHADDIASKRTEPAREDAIRAVRRHVLVPKWRAQHEAGSPFTFRRRRVMPHEDRPFG